MQSYCNLTADQVGISTSLSMASESWLILDALTIVTRSMHNCRVFSYHGGIQKLTALLKAAVVQLKTVISALSADESLSNTMVEKTGILQKVLVYVVSVISNFIDLHSYPEEKFPLNRSNMELFVTSSETSSETSTTAESLVSETMLLWHQKSVISVMEAGGLNWLVVPADRILVLSFEVLCSMPLCDVSNPYSLNFGDIHPSRPHGYLSLL
ncbi:uncharacterized protein LOC111381867 [Olea europaea var. sylvestris]|uniref:uncharacterized protein LOC111381867 n=1 Tax=Olea europaea var. sylvestris TaxID=158386 RepID=UPI000C1CFD62|nr:uncharacterized protein LOC111381867 [Olea europaea var. sylvestris]